MTDSFRIFGGSVLAHPLPEILTKHNIKEADSKVNIWGPFYTPKGSGLEGWLKNKKISCHKNLFRH